MINNNIFYTSVYFDWDSTLVDIEGLDELAGFYGKKEEIARYTEKSMSGQVKLEDVFSLKLAMIRPTKADFERLADLYLRHVNEDAKEVIETLTWLKKKVVVMTGNFYPALEKLINHLGIKEENVFANNIFFDDKGNYLTFDNKGPLSVAGGKKSLMMILKRHNQKDVFVGDGSTDAETRPPVEFFIGYGGVTVRENIKKLADVFISCKSLSAILPFILTKDEKNSTLKSKHKKLLLKGEKLIENGYGVVKDI